MAQTICSAIVVVLLSFLCGMRAGRLLILWEKETENRNDECKNGDDKI